jgi:methylmalonyl-CoA mutase N-terminal domain/subunit
MASAYESGPATEPQYAGFDMAGVVIDSLDDMRVLFSGIPLDKVATSMTADAPAALPLLLYQLVGEEQGVAADKLTGTLHNDAPEEHITRNTRIFPPEPSLRLTADVPRYCRAEIPQWNTVSDSGRHLADAGLPHVDPVTEVRRAERLAKLRAWRDQERVDHALSLVRKTAAGTDNVLYPHEGRSGGRRHGRRGVRRAPRGVGQLSRA